MSDSWPCGWNRAFKPVAKESGGWLDSNDPGKMILESQLRDVHSHRLTEPRGALHIGLTVQPGESVHHEALDLGL